MDNIFCNDIDEPGQCSSARLSIHRGTVDGLTFISLLKLRMCKSTPLVI